MNINSITRGGSIENTSTAIDTPSVISSSENSVVIFEDVRASIEMICNLLAKLVETNDQFPVAPTHVTRFHARSVPAISIKKYLQRILKYAPFPSVCLFTVLAYIDRLARKHSYFIINSFNIHRVILTTLTLAVKFHCDHLYTNRHYAKVGGISSRELMTLEFDMLTLLDFRAYISREEVEVYSHRLVSLHIPLHLFPLSSSSSVSVNSSAISTPTPSRAPTPQPQSIQIIAKATANTISFNPTHDIIQTSHDSQNQQLQKHILSKLMVNNMDAANSVPSQIVEIDPRFHRHNSLNGADHASSQAIAAQQLQQQRKRKSFNFFNWPR